MQMVPNRYSLWLVAAACLVLASPAHAAESQIGVAAVVQNDVQGILGANTRALSVGSGVFSNERIRTGDSSTAQLLLLDKTTLTVGPKAELLLDRFAYNPNRGSGEVVLNSVRGAFQFVTGSQDPRKYTIKTPAATLGIRGTIIKWFIFGDQVGIFLVAGATDIHLNNGTTIPLTQPGTGFIVSTSGAVQGPIATDTALMGFPGDISNVSDLGNFNAIDQLHGLIQQPQIICEWECVYGAAARGRR